MVALARNHDREVQGVWYENVECSSALVIELLAIQVGCMVSNIFLEKKVQIESKCKIAMEALLSIRVCLWHAILLFQIVRSQWNSLEKVDIVWYP